MNEMVVTDDLHGFQVWQGPARVMGASHIHSDIEINFVIQGGVDYFMDGRFYEIRENDLAVIWAGMPHSLRRNLDDARMMWVVVPMAWFLQWQLDEAFTGALLQGQMMILRNQDAFRREMMARWVQEFGGIGAPLADKNKRRIVALEVEAMLRRVAVESAGASPARLPVRGAKNPSPHSPAAVTQIEKLTSFISQNYRKDVTVADIAEAANLHPHYAMQVFREKCGLSLWEYVLRLRVSHAQYLLLTTQRKMSEVARDAGFASESRFYAAFEKYSQSSPRAWREEMLSPQTKPGSGTAASR